MRKCVEKRVRFDSHACYLNSYVKYNKAPKGLQVKLSPSMSTLNDTERNQWTKILNDASVSLTKLVMEHSTRKAQELKSTELAKRKESVLSELEQCELERYENKKQVMAEKRKSKSTNEINFPFARTGRHRWRLRGWTAALGPQ